MNKIFQHKSFKIGFIIGILLFISANIYTTIPDRGKGEGFSFDGYETFGFPFALHESGTMAHLNQFIWAGVVADITIAIVFSFVVAILFDFIWTKFLSRRTKLN